jgi:hypothetical protein
MRYQITLFIFTAILTAPLAHSEGTERARQLKRELNQLDSASYDYQVKNLERLFHLNLGAEERPLIEVNSLRKQTNNDRSDIAKKLIRESQFPPAFIPKLLVDIRTVSMSLKADLTKLYELNAPVDRLEEALTRQLNILENAGGVNTYGEMHEIHGNTAKQLRGQKPDIHFQKVDTQAIMDKILQLTRDISIAKGRISGLRELEQSIDDKKERLYALVPASTALLKACTPELTDCRISSDKLLSLEEVQDLHNQLPYLPRDRTLGKDLEDQRKAAKELYVKMNPERYKENAAPASTAGDTE